MDVLIANNELKAKAFLAEIEGKKTPLHRHHSHHRNRENPRFIRGWHEP